MDRSYEFDPSPPSWVVRLATTPLSDVLRGRLPGKYSARDEIATSGLPMPIAGIIFAVVNRTRLKRSEKIDVARELINHFGDGLAAGRTAEQLADDFGSVPQAARLIRQAKLRKRPLYWQAWWYLSRTFLLGLLLAIAGYGILAVRFFLTAPNISHNYWEEANALRRMPEDERAWPLYRKAGFLISEEDDETLSDAFVDGLADPLTPELVTLLYRNQASLKLCREAAGREKLGYLYGDPEDKAAAQAANKPWLMSGNMPLASENRPVIALDLSGMDVLRKLARLLVIDARKTAADGDGTKAMQDIRSLLGVSAQVFQPQSSLVEQLVAISIFRQATDTIGDILDKHAAAWNDAQLRDLAHDLAAYCGGNIRIDFDAEQTLFLDLVQRIYSDDGQGDGRVTPEGLRMLSSLGRDYTVVAPGVAALVADRAETEKFYRELIEEGQFVRQGPPWTWNSEEIRRADQRFDAAATGPRARMKYMLPLQLMPSIFAAIEASEAAITYRDAIETAIALELYRRRNGAWPERLDQLVPALLPAPPLDRYTGQPLHYILVEDHPKLYSVGCDRDDDGGRPANPPEQTFSDPLRPAGRDGDWILWAPGETPSSKKQFQEP